jgi:RHS repeat-associated protein
VRRRQAYGGNDNPSQKFTGKERDFKTGNDFFGERYSSALEGRFTAPTPKIMTGRHLMSPQEWNKYAYVQDNRPARIDPDGLAPPRLSVKPKMLVKG